MRMLLLAPVLALLLVSACGKSDEQNKAEQTGPEASQPASAPAGTAMAPVGASAGTASPATDDAGEALADPEGPPLDEEDEGGEGDPPDASGTAGTASPDATGSITRTVPSAPQD